MRFPLELWGADAERAAVLARAIEASDGPMAVIDPIGNVVFVNPAAEALWGESASALINRAAVSLLGADASREEADTFGARLERGQPWEGEAHLRGPDAGGPMVPARFRVQPVAAPGAEAESRILGAVIQIRPTS